MYPCDYRNEVIDDMPGMPPVLDLDSPPSKEEITMAVSKLKRQKAAARNITRADH